MLRLMSLNIERDKHYACWQPFVASYQPDILCLQEVYEDDIPTIANKLALPQTAFTPLTMHGRSPEGRTNAVMGQAILSRYPLENLTVHRYYGESDGRTIFDDTSPTTKVHTSQYALLIATVNGFRIATTHMVWTPDGHADDHQRAATTRMLEYLDTEPELSLCGDFNAPRGREIFTRIAARYTDHIPAHYMNSVDKTLHRAGATIADLMVDGLFTTPHYTAHDVELHSGLSDHMGITATLTHR